MEEYTRFWSKVDKTDTCWNWTGSKVQNGYGKLSYQSRQHMAHRFAYEISVAPIPEGMFVDHVCSNRACVNPEHLRLATRKQNSEHLTGPYKGNPTGYRGVERRGDRFRASVRHNKKLYYLGTFDTPEEANEVATAKRLDLFTHNDRDRMAS